MIILRQETRESNGQAGKDERLEKMSGRRENDENIAKGEGENGRVLSEKGRGSERLSGRS